jgi:hypothetical protein
MFTRLSALLNSPCACSVTRFLGGSVALRHAKAGHFIDYSTANHSFLLALLRFLWVKIRELYALNLRQDRALQFAAIF